MIGARFEFNVYKSEVRNVKKSLCFAHAFTINGSRRRINLSTEQKESFTINTSILLTEREGRIEDYWLEALALSTDRAQQGPYEKTTERQYLHQFSSTARAS